MGSRLFLFPLLCACLQSNGIPGQAGAVSNPQSTATKVQGPSELQVYANAKSVVDMSPSELITAFPEVTTDLRFVDNQDELGPLLQRAGENVRAFFEYFPNTSSLEEIVQERFRLNGERIARGSNSYYYLMLPRTRVLLDFEEYRTNRDGKPLQLRGRGRGLMDSFAFAWYLIHIHPSFQADSQFRYVGLDPKSGAHVITFAQKPEAARTVGLITLNDPSLLSQNVLILIQGFIWIDPATGQIARMHTDLLAPRYDMGLKGNSTDIECVEVHFEQLARSFWLPREVIVTTTYRNEIFRNRHRYTKYQLFTVESWDKVKAPVPPPESLPETSLGPRRRNWNGHTALLPEPPVC